MAWQGDDAQFAIPLFTVLIDLFRCLELVLEFLRNGFVFLLVVVRLYVQVLYVGLFLIDDREDGVERGQERSLSKRQAEGIITRLIAVTENDLSGAMEMLLEIGPGERLRACLKR